MLLPGQKSHFFANAMGCLGVRLLVQVPSAFVHHSYAPNDNTRVRDVSVGGCIARKLLACAVAVLVAACGQSPDSTATDDPAAASMEHFRDWSELPDWSGWWEMEGGFEAVRAASQAGGQSNSGSGVRPVLANLDVYQPEARRIAAAARVPGVNRGGVGVYCVPHRFNGGINGGRTNDVEFLLMPQRLTITNGDGLLRRIPIDGRPLRENPEPSNGGTSVGRWEGDTLIVETIGLYPDTTFPTASNPNLPQIGENVHVVERLRLNEQDQLVIDTVLTAPQLLTAPINFTTVYQRDPGYVYRDHDVCSLHDRSVDHETGFERFDLTPPADLPPPPPPPN